MMKVLIAEDNQILANALRDIINQEPDITVTGCATNGLEALAFCDKSLPDIIVMDIKMPECDGIEGTRLIKQKYPTTKIIILTTFLDDRLIAGALKNGADSYVLKDINERDLIMTLRATFTGFSVVRQNAFDSIKHQIGAKYLKQTEKISVELTEIQKEIIRLIVDGKSNKEIAAELHFVEGSVRNMISDILEKFGFKDRTQLAVFAVKNDLV